MTLSGTTIHYGSKLLLNIMFYRNHYDIIFLLFILTLKIWIIRNVEITYFKVIEINKMYPFINNY